MNVWVYVDGFNLYYHAAKPTGCKWLDLLSLFQKVMPSDTIARVKYFTALVDYRRSNPHQRWRQTNYWRALGTLGCVSIHKGKFKSEVVPMPTEASVNLIASGQSKSRYPKLVNVVKTEEKRTDVNLASHLIHDAHCGRYDMAMVVTGDTDLTEAIRIVRSHIGVQVHVFKPDPGVYVAELRQVATSLSDLDHSLLPQSLFPPVLTDVDGHFGVPPSWW